LLVPIC